MTFQPTEAGWLGRLGRLLRDRLDTAGLSRSTLNDRGVLGLALAGAVTMFLVQPPADCWMLAWLAPLPWLAIVLADRISAVHPWRSLWIGGFCHWLATIHWLRLPHPATSIGWVALSVYLACYLPLFVAIARRLVHGWRWPLVVAACRIGGRLGRLGEALVCAYAWAQRRGKRLISARLVWRA